MRHANRCDVQQQSNPFRERRVLAQTLEGEEQDKEE